MYSKVPASFHQVVHSTLWRGSRGRGKLPSLRMSFPSGELLIPWSKAGVNRTNKYGLPCLSSHTWECSNNITMEYQDREGNPCAISSLPFNITHGVLDIHCNVRTHCNSSIQAKSQEPRISHVQTNHAEMTENGHRDAGHLSPFIVYLCIHLLWKLLFPRGWEGEKHRQLTSQEMSIDKQQKLIERLLIPCGWLSLLVSGEPLKL